MIFWGQIRVDKNKLEQIMTLPNFTFGQLGGRGGGGGGILMKLFDMYLL